MAVTFALKGFAPCKCLEGRTQFTAKLIALNIDTGIVYDNANPTTDPNALLMALAEYGDNIVIKHFSVQYIGAAPGMILQPTIYTSDDTLAFLETHYTLLKTDKCGWAGLHIPVTFKKMYHYLFRMTVTGYTSGADDMTATIHGEVF